jgi:hypothetical protein
MRERQRKRAGGSETQKIRNPLSLSCIHCSHAAMDLNHFTRPSLIRANAAAAATAEPIVHTRKGELSLMINSKEW